MLLNGSRTAFACLVEPLMDMLGLLGLMGGNGRAGAARPCFAIRVLRDRRVKFSVNVAVIRIGSRLDGAPTRMPPGR